MYKVSDDRLKELIIFYSTVGLQAYPGTVNKAEVVSAMGELLRLRGGG